MKKQKTRKNKRYQNKHKNKNKIGGDVLASGGFGCVFKPALKCAGDDNNIFRPDNTVSKLMITRYAESEYEEITSIREKLNKIPSYKDYFLIDNINLCEPAKLNEEDLKNFKKKCTALPKNDITINNVNNSLDQLTVMNMPDGGLPVDDFIYKYSSFKLINKINKQMIELLKNGIMPMNEMNIYHSDIKDGNILIEEKDKDTKLYPRLIDWGLCVKYTPFINEKFPRKWRNRPLQFNVPFSVIIFSDDFYDKYSEYLSEKEKEKSLDKFVEDFIYYWMKKRGIGHYKFINEIMHKLFDHDLERNLTSKQRDDIIEKNYTIKYIKDYVVDVLEHYTKFKEDKTLNLREYLDNVYVKIIDIWGFICCYYTILEFLSNNYTTLNKNQLKMFDKVKYIFLKYLYEPRHVPIEIDDLIKDLNELGNLFLHKDVEIKNSAIERKPKLKSKSHVKTKSHTGVTNKKKIFSRTSSYKTMKKRNYSLLSSLKIKLDKNNMQIKYKQ